MEIIHEVYMWLLKHSETENRLKSHLVPKRFELAGGAGVQIHELVPVHQQSRLLALVLLLKSQEASALHLQDTGQVSDVTLEC